MRKLHIIGATVIAVVFTATALSATAGTSTPPKRKANIVKTAAAAGQFKTLISLVKAAGLAPALTGKTQLTVFAPTDRAFSKVPAGTLAELKSDPAKLRAVLLYHVVKGRLPAAKVVKLRSATTLNGAKVRIRVARGKVYVNSARVIRPDVRASNGIIHVINQVLIPPAA
jgi:uncharacterized surface protein with fasciclin (FAS1) repeats